VNERPEDTGVFQRRATDLAGRFIVAHLWKIIVGLAGFFSGGAVTYIAIWERLSDVSHATTELRATVDKLVTKQELDDAKERISTLEDRLDFATKEAGTAPIARHPRKK
jgi:hypothetical protein